MIRIELFSTCQVLELKRHVHCVTATQVGMT